MLRLGCRRLCAAAASTSRPASPTTSDSSSTEVDKLTPRSIVSVLDQFIVGQQDAKKAVAISLRNRWRRRQLVDEDLRADIMPKNILMIGPTGVGKTEISRRMARITDAPFIKVEATKYTESGFKGKDVESIIEDLYANAKTKARRRLERERSEEVEAAALQVLYASWVRRHGGRDDVAEESGESLSFEKFAEKVKAGELDKDEVSLDVTVTPPERKPAGPDVLYLGMTPQRIIQHVTKPLADAFPLAKNEVLSRIVDATQLDSVAKILCEQEGIVFLDEIDKVVSPQGSPSADVSSLGVQQDLLPIIEGSSVTMKDGTIIKTDGVLFICSGAFHAVKPSEMIAELQGRLPIRVELKALNEKEFRRILVEPKFNLLAQQAALLGTEGLDVRFADDGIDELARITAQVNSRAQNIGARRLHTIIEQVVEEYSFDSESYLGKPIVIDAAHVRKVCEPMLKNVDLSRYLM